MSNVFTITTELKLNREYNQLVGKYISDYIELFNKIQRLTFHRIKNYHIKNGKITIEPTDEMLVIIIDENTVNENTVFWNGSWT